MIDRFKTSILVPPAEEPLTAAELRKHALITLTTDDAFLTALAKGERQRLESLFWSAFITQTWILYLDRFPSGDIEIPNPPLQSATITYVDSAGTTQTLDTDQYEVVTSCKPGYIRRAYGVSWPTTLDHEDSVSVTYICGYGAASAVPDSIKTALALSVSCLYADREQGLSPAAERAISSLCSPYDYSSFR